MKPNFVGLSLLAGSLFFACDKSTPPTAPSVPVVPLVVPSLRVGFDTSIVLVAGDSVRLAFVPQAKTTYQFTTLGATDTRLELKDSAGTKLLVRDQDSSAVNALIEWTAATNAPVSILVSGATKSVSGPATLHVVKTNGPDAHEPDSTLHGATSLAPDSSEQSHTFTSGDVDWYKIQVSGGTTYRVATSGVYADLQWISSDSAVLGTAMYGFIEYRPKASGFIYVRCTPSTTLTTGSYSIRAWPDKAGIDKYEPDDTRETAVLISTDSVPQSHYWQQGEVDWIRFKADSGKRYRVITRNSELSMEVYAYRDTASVYFAHDQNGLVFLARKSGDVYAMIQGFRSSAYTVAVSIDTVGIDKYEPDDRWTQATSISTDSTVQKHFLQVEDTDWVKFQVDSGASYLIQASNVWITLASLQVYFDSVSVGSAPITYYGSTGLKATRTGTVYVAVARVSDAYTLSVTKDASVADRYEPNDSKATATSLQVDSAAQLHSLQAGDRDWIRFDADSGKTYTVQVQDSGAEPVDVKVRSATSDSVLFSASSWAAHKAVITIKSTARRAYYLDISDPFSRYVKVYSVQVTSN